MTDAQLGPENVTLKDQTSPSGVVDPEVAAESPKSPDAQERTGGASVRELPESTEAYVTGNLHGVSESRSSEIPAFDDAPTQKGQTTTPKTPDTPAPVSGTTTEKLINLGIINNYVRKDGSGAQRSRKEDARLRNPTREFQFDKERPLLVEEGIVRASDWLHEYAMVAIASDLQEIALSAAKHVIDHHTRGDSISLLSYNRRDADIEHKGNGTDTVQSPAQSDYYSFQILRLSLHLVPRSSIILVDLTAEQLLDDARAFMAPFLASDTNRAFFDDFSLLLAKRRQRLIFLLPESVGADPILKKRLQVLPLNAIRILLAQEFRDTLDETVAEVQRQITQGQWGEDPKRELLRARADTSLNRRITEYRNYSESDRQKDQQTYLALLNRDAKFRPINEVVIFVGVWFRDLAEPHFERVVEALLDDETMEAPSTTPGCINSEQCPSTASDPTPASSQLGTIINVYAGAAQLVPQPTLRQIDLSSQTLASIPLLELWRRRARTDVVRDCRIALQTGIDGRKYFGFVEPHLGAIARSALESEAPFHFGAYFQKVLDAGLVFDRSIQVADSALHLIREGMSRASDEYDWRWLRTIIRDALSAHDLLDPANSSSLADFVIKCSARSFVMSRWTRLLQLLFDDERLARSANDLLGNLIELGQHADVFELVQRLRTSLGLDTVHWLKRLIAEGSPGVRCQAINYLRVYVQTSPAQTSQLVSTLRGWLPSAQNDRARTSALNAAAVWVPLHIATVALQRHNFGSTSLPHLFPILSDQALPDLPTSFAETLDLILYPLQSAAPSDTLTALRKLLSEDILPTIPGFCAVLDDLGEVLSGGIVGEVPTPNGSEFIPALVLVVNHLRESGANAPRAAPRSTEWDFSALIQLLVTAWFWIIDDATDVTTANATRANIADLMVARLTLGQVQVMRHIFNGARDLVSRIAEGSARPLRGHLLRFNRTSRCVNDAIYSARKRKQCATRR